MWRIDFDRRIYNDGRGGISAIKRCGINERFKAGSRLAFRLRGAVKNRGLIGKPALHRDHTSRVDVHGDKTALNLWDLAQSPADKRPVVVGSHPAYQHHITDLYQITGNFGLGPKLAIVQLLARPLNVLGGDEMALCGFRHIFDADPRIASFGAEHHSRVPRIFKINVPRHAHSGQRFAPSGLIAQLGFGNFLARAAPNANATVIFLQLALQRFGGDGLHFIVDCGADGQTTGKKLALAKVFRQLAAYLVGEIVARRQIRLKAFKVAVLDRPQRLRDLVLINSRRDIAVFFHLAQHEIAALQQTILAADRVII